jgi:hypothetical protein
MGRKVEGSHSPIENTTVGSPGVSTPPAGESTEIRGERVIRRFLRLGVCAPLVDVCRELDGILLAIEPGAVRVPASAARWRLTPSPVRDNPWTVHSSCLPARFELASTAAVRCTHVQVKTGVRSGSTDANREISQLSMRLDPWVRLCPRF